MLAAWSRAGMPSCLPPRKSCRGLTLLCLCFSASGRCSTRVLVTMSSPEAEKTWVKVGMGEEGRERKGRERERKGGRGRGREGEGEEGREGKGGRGGGREGVRRSSREG